MERVLPENQLVIGWQEYVALPDWGIPYIRAKADTGARSSAVDVLDLEELPGERARFGVALSRKNRDHTTQVEAPIVRRTRVRSAHGTTQDRLFVETKVRIGPVTKVIELGLVCRKKMICRMLLGRSALSGSFLVESDARYLFGDREEHQQRHGGRKSPTR
ncbi:MAG: RimK/LysX family protein [Planctomycetota bacterium]